jgi:drug/metabolite transporter (DMT)-like permease
MSSECPGRSISTPLQRELLNVKREFTSQHESVPLVETLPAMWETASIPPNAKLIVGMMIFTCSSICMSVGNKRAVMLFPYHNLLIVFQNLVSIIATMLFMRSHVSLPNPKWLVYWIPTAVLFSLVLLSSVKAMSALNLTSVMIFRNITPIPSTLVEYLIFNTRVSLRSVLALCGVLVGVLAYAWVRQGSLGCVSMWCAWSLSYSITDSFLLTGLT